MKQNKDWFYDESLHCGVDYSQKDKAGVYDQEMETFRDYKAEVKDFIAKLGNLYCQEMAVADIGCGSGAFAVNAAAYFRKIYAVDISPAMLDVARHKAQAANIANIEFCPAGFLNFTPVEKLDMIHTRLAFHHLPDYWKQAALLNLGQALKPGGLLFISDVIFRFDPNFEGSIEALLTQLSAVFSPQLIQETKTHLKEEYSTFDWIIRGMLERAGFEVLIENTDNCVAAEFLCRKR